ncbi:hypothetical protein [Streptomyces sp. NPDC056227]|uniref:hypothetical protein n=1 Tax=Streptomyces sp. NPDC056227 TaxID=3345753 RepID=UPI0035DF3135
MVDRARDIVTGYGEMGCMLRQVHYRLVAEGLIPNIPPTYRRRSSRLAQARRDGHFPDLIDTLREVHVSPAWGDARDFLGDVPDWFAPDRTAGQKAALYVAAEKDTCAACSPTGSRTSASRPWSYAESAPSPRRYRPSATARDPDRVHFAFRAGPA